MVCAIGWLATNSRDLWKPTEFNYVTVEFETEVWTNSRGDTREEAVSATLTYDIPFDKATFFPSDYDALEALKALRRLDKEGNVTRLSARFGAGAWTPGVEDLAIFELMQKKVEEAEI